MIKNTKENDTSNSRITLPLWTVFLLSLFLVVLLYALFKDRFFEGPSKVTDLIVDQVVLDGSNKTGELDFFWKLLWGGCFFVLAFFLIGRTPFLSCRKLSETNASCHTRLCPAWLIGVLCFIPPLAQTILYGKASVFLWLFAALFCLIFCLHKENPFALCAFFLFVYFDLQVIALCLGLYNGVTVFSDGILFGIALLLFLTFIAGFKKYPKCFDRFFFLMQLPLPLLLLLYCKNTYSFEGKLIHLSYPIAYILFVLLLIVSLYAFLVFSRKKTGPFDGTVSITSAISIFLYGSYIPAAMIVPSDMHHHGEQMLPWQQIVTLGNTAYDTYSPVSGLFPMLIGGIHDLLGATATTYAAAFTIVFLLFGILIISMISLHVDGKWTLLFAFLFHMPVYCRTWIILPVLLFLMHPKVRANKRRFLSLYVFTGFLSGLYYPLFGFALILAILPYALILTVSYFKTREVVDDFKKQGSYIETLLFILPILISLPLLYRMASHVLAYSHQTVLGDGLSLHTVTVPDWFLPYLSSADPIRASIYYALRFLGSMLPVWLFLLFLLTFIYKKGVIKAISSPAFLGLSAGFLLLPVCYTYTVVIMDEGWVSRLFSRSSHLYLWILGIFLPILLICYGRELFEDQTHTAIVMTLALTVPFLCFYQMKDYQFPALDGTTNAECSCIGNYSANLSPFPITESYLSVSETDVSMFPSIGYGFVQSDVLNRLYDYSDRLSTLHEADDQLKILGLDKMQMYYFLLNESALYSGKASLAKSKTAADSVISHIDEHTIIGSDLSPLNNYYIYRYCMDQGFVYDPLTGFYLSPTLYTTLYGKDVYMANSLADSPWADPIYLAKCPSTLGANLSNLGSKLYPSDSDRKFLYVEIDPALLSDALSQPVDEHTILTICWDGIGMLWTDYADGKLLIPLDMNADWATNPYTSVYVGLFDASNPNMPPTHKVDLAAVCQTFEYYDFQSEASQ